MTKEAEEKCLSELKKLKMMPPMSAESTVVRNYIDTLLELPWKKKSRVSKDIAKADLVLNADHYGLEKVKERILEYLAVQKRINKLVDDELAERLDVRLGLPREPGDHVAADPCPWLDSVDRKSVV